MAAGGGGHPGTLARLRRRRLRRGLALARANGGGRRQAPLALWHRGTSVGRPRWCWPAAAASRAGKARSARILTVPRRLEEIVHRRMPGGITACEVPVDRIAGTEVVREESLRALSGCAARRLAQRRPQATTITSSLSHPGTLAPWHPGTLARLRHKAATAGLAIARANGGWRRRTPWPPTILTSDA
jgi:hypothetical protein